ncbi:hypothetical protein QT971_19730 [Microcoleus sp. herbarium19]|uniref:hypothetical protein n=1 Tax=unclassified Microcoleus TaxID=2642155 RepID=UPI002FCF5DD9
MVGPRDRIQQDLAQLEEALAALTLEFHSTYENYLTALGQAVRQQLILACYHLCTQAVPESFLKLSFDGRQKMQQAVRLLAAESETKLRSLTAESEAEEAEEEEEEEFGEDELEEDELEEGEEIEEYELEEDEESEEEKEFSAINYQFAATNYQLPIANSPESLARWQNSIEKSIAQIVKLLSHDTNRLLQLSGMLPSQLPEPVLEAASAAELSGDSIAGPPNLLNIVIETDSSPAPRNLPETSRQAMHITAIKLRLSEIEFADAATSAWRQQIRNLSVRLNSLGRDYQKKQREMAVVEAESAWRSSWFED